MSTELAFELRRYFSRLYRKEYLKGLPATSRPLATTV
jgi:hypothetical protein